MKSRSVSMATLPPLAPASFAAPPDCSAPPGTAKASAAETKNATTIERVQCDECIDADPPRDCETRKGNAGALLCLWLEPREPPDARARARREARRTRPPRGLSPRLRQARTRRQREAEPRA